MRQRLASLAIIPVLGVGTLVGVAPHSDQKAPNLRSKLLTIDQMPAGWTESRSTSGGVGCLKHILEPKSIRIKGEASATYSASSGLPQLEESLAIYSSTKRAYSKIVRALDSCRHPSGVLNGTAVVGTVKRMSLPRYGSVSAAYFVHFTAGSTSLGEDVLIARVGTTLMGLTEGGIGKPKLRQFEHFAKLGIARLRSGRT